MIFPNYMCPILRGLRKLKTVSQGAVVTKNFQIRVGEEMRGRRHWVGRALVFFCLQYVIWMMKILVSQKRA